MGLLVTQLHKKVDADSLPLGSDRQWAQIAYRDASRLVAIRLSPFAFTNRDKYRQKRAWYCLNICFDFNEVVGRKLVEQVQIRATETEPWATLGANRQAGKWTTYFLQRRPNMKWDALVNGVNTAKQLYDGSFKLPKVMKDMANGSTTPQKSMLEPAILFTVVPLWSVS